MNFLKSVMLPGRSFAPMASESTGRTFNTRLAKAETLLCVALLTDLILETWVYPRVEIPAPAKTLIKMTIIVGLYGPVLEMLSQMIDSGLNLARKTAVKTFSVPRMGFHLVI